MPSSAIPDLMAHDLCDRYDPDPGSLHRQAGFATQGSHDAGDLYVSGGTTRQNSGGG